MPCLMPWREKRTRRSRPKLPPPISKEATTNSSTFKSSVARMLSAAPRGWKYPVRNAKRAAVIKGSHESAVPPSFFTLPGSGEPGHLVCGEGQGGSRECRKAGNGPELTTIFRERRGGGEEKHAYRSAESSESLYQ